MSQSLLINPSAFEAGLEAAFLARSATNERQAAAFERFARQGLPNRRVEGWKWSDFNAALRAETAGAAEPAAPAASDGSFAALDALEISIVNGRIETPSELPAGVRFGILDAVATIPELETHPIASLNVAMTRKAFALEVEEGVAFERPILIRHRQAGSGFSFAQTMLRLCENASATIIETFEGDGAGFYSHLVHGDLRDGARLKRYVLDDAGARARTHSLFALKVDRARLDQTSLSFGGALTRHESVIHFLSEGGSVNTTSASLLSGARHADFTSHVLHRAPACVARVLHKGVASGKARNVFQGKFEVDRAAQKTDAQMTANALLLSDGAEANHKPELEIYADDVECAHGSTAGALDEDALFYLRQRGLSEAEARGLLIEAFVGEAIDAIDNDSIREVFAIRAKTAMETL
ncbi:MAG: Fe-S cluster assembly protein SufD [Pseudomonadota bacterium]